MSNQSENEVQVSSVLLGLVYTNTECDAVVKDKPFPKRDCKITRSRVFASVFIFYPENSMSIYIRQECNWLSHRLFLLVSFLIFLKCFHR